MRLVQHVPELSTIGWIGGPDERDTRHEFTNLYHVALRISRRPLPQLYFISRQVLTTRKSHLHIEGMGVDK
jgi:hypothetical protein